MAVSWEGKNDEKHDRKVPIEKLRNDHVERLKDAVAGRLDGSVTRGR